MEFTIVEDLCTSCGACARDCPTGSAQDGGPGRRFVIDNASCIECSHCGMVCPEDAVRVDGERLPGWDDPGLRYEDVRSFLAARRSVRRYTDEAVSMELVRELTGQASLTSSSSNIQDWEALILLGDGVRTEGKHIAGYWARLIRLIGFPPVRAVALLTEGRRYVRNGETYRRHRDRILSYYDGDDWLFFHAPAVVILTYPRSNSRMGMTNCALAGSRMMDLAHAKGLGTCMIGFASIAINMSSRVRKALGMAKDRRAGLVFTLGHPAVRYRRLPVRKEMPVRHMD